MFLSSEARASLTCNHPGNCDTSLSSPNRCPGNDAFSYIHISSDAKDPYAAREVFVCKDKWHIDTNNLRGFGLSAVGWGEYCARYAGGNSVSDKSCVAAESMIGELVDNLTTVGVGVLMRKNFCSFSPGDPALEGGLISVNSCSQAIDQVACLRCLLRGKAAVTDGSPPSDTDYYAETGCSANPFEDPFGLNGASTQGSGSPISLSSSEIKTVQPNSDGNGYTDNICSSAIPNLGKPLYDVNGNTVTVPYNNTNVPVYCPVTRCNIPTKDIKVKYFDEMKWRMGIIAVLAGVVSAVAPEVGTAIWGAAGVLEVWSLAEGNCCDVTKLSENSVRTSVGFLKIIQLKGELKGDQMCANMFFPFGGWRTLACKAATDKPIKFPQPPCVKLLQKTACGGGVAHSKGILPITSRVMECANDLFGYFFTPPPADAAKDCQVSSFATFQQNMKNIVRLLLILYVILFGIKVLFGEKINKKEIFSFLLKFALVIFFSVGNFYDSQVSNDEHQNGLIFARNLLQSATNSFSVMVIEALQGDSIDPKGDNLCSFKDAGYDPKYNYLEIWDTLDCRILSYLSFLPPVQELENSMESSGRISRIRHGLFAHAWALLFSFYGMPIIIFLSVFTIFLLSLVVSLAHLYILSMLATTVLIFFGPIFVPMALFDATQDMYEKWLKLLVGYALQPVIVLGIIVFMIITFDKIIFTDCKFTKEHFKAKPSHSFWVLKDDGASSYCKKSLGYLLANMSPGKLSHMMDFVVSSDPIINDENKIRSKPLKTSSYIALVEDVFTLEVQELFALLEALALTSFFMILFYVFASQMMGLAQQLVGGAGFGDMVISSTALIDAALDAVVMVATQGQASFSDVKQAAETADRSLDGVKVLGAAEDALTSPPGKSGSGSNPLPGGGSGGGGGSSGGGGPTSPAPSASGGGKLPTAKR